MESNINNFVFNNYLPKCDIYRLAAMIKDKLSPSNHRLKLTAHLVKILSARSLA